jgi:hypothetical protein
LDRAWVCECRSDPSREGKKISEIASERGVEPEEDCRFRHDQGKWGFENPQQRPEEIEYVLINGRLAVEKGRYTQIEARTVLRHKA